MFIPKKLVEDELEPKKPLNPKIVDKEAFQAQQSINNDLKRKDISTNAQPSNEFDPLIVLLHGYGSSKWLFIEPYFGSYGWLRDYRSEPKPRSYGWHSKPPPSHMYLPFTYTLSPLKHPEGTFKYLARNKVEVFSYSQLDPFGDIDTSARELELILSSIEKIYGERKLILVGHSRGGLCIRRYLDVVKNTSVHKVITLGTPHKGTNILNFKGLKQPLLKLLNESKAKRFWDVKGWRQAKDIKHEQMAINSEFLGKLTDREKYPDIKYIAAGGTVSTFAYLYSWSIERKITSKTKDGLFNIESNNKFKMRDISSYQWIAVPKKVLAIFESTLLPEFKHGDGLVSLDSAIFRHADKKYKINTNHEELPNSEEVKRLLLKEVKKSRKSN